MRPPSTLLPGQVQVTQAQYEAIALAHVKELWTQFGNLTEVWLDGGCGAMCDAIGAALATCNGTANAVAFNGGGGVSTSPVRWCGTEGGNPSGWPTVWSTAAGGWCPDGSGSGDRPDTPNAAWYPSGVDVTLQQGMGKCASCASRVFKLTQVWHCALALYPIGTGDRWFYMPGVAVHPIQDLVSFYHHSVRYKRGVVASAVL